MRIFWIIFPFKNISSHSHFSISSLWLLQMPHQCTATKQVLPSTCFLILFGTKKVWINMAVHYLLRKNQTSKKFGNYLKNPLFFANPNETWLNWLARVGKIAYISAWSDENCRIFTNGQILSQSIFLHQSLFPKYIRCFVIYEFRSAFELQGI